MFTGIEKNTTNNALFHNDNIKNVHVFLLNTFFGQFPVLDVTATANGQKRKQDDDPMKIYAKHFAGQWQSKPVYINGIPHLLQPVDEGTKNRDPFGRPSEEDMKDLADKPLNLTTHKVPKTEDAEDNYPVEMTEQHKQVETRDGRIHTRDILAAVMKNQNIEGQLHFLQKLKLKYPQVYQQFLASGCTEQQRYLNSLLGQSNETVEKLTDSDLLQFNGVQFSQTQKEASVPQQAMEVLASKVPQIPNTERKTCLSHQARKGTPRKNPKPRPAATCTSSDSEPLAATSTATHSQPLLMGQSCGPPGIPGIPQLVALGMVDEEGCLPGNGIESAQAILGHLHISKKGAGSHTNS